MTSDSEQLPTKHTEKSGSVSNQEKSELLLWARSQLGQLEQKITEKAAQIGEKAFQNLRGDKKQKASLIHTLARKQLFHQTPSKEVGQTQNYTKTIGERKQKKEQSEQLTNLTVGLYILLTKLSEKRGSLDNLQTSKVVEKNTPWELLLSVHEKEYRQTNASIETQEGKPIDQESMAKVALLWLSRNNGKYPNQPFDTVLHEQNGAFDPRIRTGSFKAALRQENGKYKIISINEKHKEDLEMLNMENTDLFTIQEVEEEKPEDVQIVVDNRAISPGNGFDINQQLECAVIGLSSTNEGIINVNGDHLYMDGVAKIDLAMHLAKFAKANKTSRLAPLEKAKHFRPLITLENLAPSLSKLSPTEMMAAYARTMLDPQIGFSGNQTILVPQIEKKDYPDVPNQNNRIQPLAIRLDDLAKANIKGSVVKETLKQTSEDITKAGLYHAMETANDPRIPKPIQKILVKVLHKLPVVGPVGESFNGVGLISAPAMATKNPTEEMNYGPLQRTNEQYHLTSNTIVSQADRAYNLVITPNENRTRNYCLSGTPDIIKPSDLVKFAHILERNVNVVLSEKEKFH